MWKLLRSVNFFHVRPCRHEQHVQAGDHQAEDEDEDKQKNEHQAKKQPGSLNFVFSAELNVPGEH